MEISIKIFYWIFKYVLNLLKAIVLWPDGVNYKLKDFPQCLLRPRYLYVPPIATGMEVKEFFNLKIILNLSLSFNRVFIQKGGA